MSKAEVMLIMILFHDSGYRCLKHFYLEESFPTPFLGRDTAYHQTEKHYERDLDEHIRQAAAPQACYIEMMNDELKNIAQIEHSRHRCFENFVVNLLGAIAAYCMFPKKPCIHIQRALDTQLCVF